MTVTATTDEPKAKTNPLADVAAALADGEVKAVDLLTLVGEKALTIAWTGGYVEFGHRDFSVTGNPNNPKTQDASELHVESGESWTGPKTGMHGSLRSIMDRGVALPRTAKYKHNRSADPGYVPAADVSPLADIGRAEAEKVVYLKCRLTDKGHQLLLAD